jgi:hypothetical protein
MSYFGLFTATCLNIGATALIQHFFFKVYVLEFEKAILYQQNNTKKMLEEQQKAIVQAIK